MRGKGMLVAIQFPSNCGYAIAPLEETFFEMARTITGDAGAVHFAYRDLQGGWPRTLPPGFANVVRFDARGDDPEQLAFIADYIRRRDIGVVFGFDLPVQAPSYPVLRQAGVHTLVSYWGAPMSSLNRGVKLLIKRMEVRMRRSQPDRYIFESEAMRRTAVWGRGIPLARTEVVPLGVDAERFRPAAATGYAHEAFAIPRERRIIAYAGHLQARKGVDVILRSAVELVVGRGRRDVHFLFLGNRDGEEAELARPYAGGEAAKHITFGGYREDMKDILPACYAGCIASTGWDSFPRSAVEMAACGLPLVASNLQGLAEIIDDGRTGALVPPKDPGALATALERLLDDPGSRDRLGYNARRRVLERYTRAVQLEGLIAGVRRAWGELTPRSSAA